MKNIKMILIVVLGLFIITCSSYMVCAQKVSSHANTPGFQDVYNLKEPSVLYFYSDECKYCVEFMPAFDKVSKEYNGKYHFVKFDVDDSKNNTLCNKFKIQTIPAVFIFEPRDKVVHPVHPYYLHTENGLKDVLDTYLKERSGQNNK